MDGFGYGSGLPQSKQYTDLSRHNIKTRPNLADIFNQALSQFISNGKDPLDTYKPKRVYTIQFTAATSTRNLIIPTYKTLASITRTDNDQFKLDKAYVAEVYAVYDLTADPTRTTNKATNFNITQKTVLLDVASDNANRTWEIVCIGVPYQGLGADILAHATTPENSAYGVTLDTFFKVIYAPDFTLATNDGYKTAKTFTYSPLIARLPVSGDAGVDAEDFTASDLTLASSEIGQSLIKAKVSGYTDSRQVVGSVITLLSVNSVRGVKASGPSDIYAEKLTSETMTVSIYPMLVKTMRRYYNPYHDAIVKDGEILLAVGSVLDGGARTKVIFSDAWGCAFDLFRLKNRPIYDGEVIVI